MNLIKRLFGSKDKDNKTGNAKNSSQTDNEKVLECLQKAVSDTNYYAEIVEDELIINDCKMSIKACIEGETKHAKAVILQLKFTINHEQFDDNIIENLAGIGEGAEIEDAINNGVSSFVQGVLSVILESFDERHNPKIDFETECEGIIRLWHPKVGTLQVQGYSGNEISEENKIFNILNEAISVRMGNKKFYWIKVYVSRQQDGNVITQCTLNNEPFYEAEKKMEAYAKSWNTTNQFKGEKQYIIVRQCDKTWNPSKYKQKDVHDLINNTIDIMANYSNPTECNSLFEKIKSLTKDINLAFELYCFIPEIYCHFVLHDVKYSDEIVIVSPDNTRKTMYLAQFNMYLQIKKIIYTRIKLGVDKDKIEKLLFLSATFGSINNAIMQGSKLENLVTGPIILQAPENYQTCS